MNRHRRAFTLVEMILIIGTLLLVALIAIPNFQRGRGRSSVSRVQADQRSMATALNSYYVDNNGYPLAVVHDYAADAVGNSQVAPRAIVPRARAADFSSGLSANAKRLAGRRVTFAHPGVAWNEPGGFATLTTPISYITSYFNDPFSPGESLTFSYLPDGPGFLLDSFNPVARDGPDPTTLSALAESMRGQFISATTTPFNGRAVATSKAILRVGTHRDGRSLTYDPTNGIASEGSAYRISD